MNYSKVLNQVLKKISKKKFDKNTKIFDLLDSLQILKLILSLEEKNLSLSFDKIKKDDTVSQISNKIKNN